MMCLWLCSYCKIITDFTVHIIYLFFKCGQYHIQVWTDHSPTTDLHVQKEAWKFVHSQ